MSKTEDEYINIFEEIKKFKLKQQKQKQRGLNDYNLLTTVLKPHDEVRLHSRMIGSLLNPDGLHYQDTLFLEKFLEIIDLKDFELNPNNITVGIEYHDIDLYITDGSKHIIIENKIWAEDQPCQIIKYINIIKEENNLTIDDSVIPKVEDIYVLYLTQRNKEMSEDHVLYDEGYITFDTHLIDKLDECSKKSNTKLLVPNGLKNYQAKYKKMNYENDIFNWLNMCIKEVENITNLNEAIKQYIHVVMMLNNNYEGAVMTLENEILKEKNNYELAQEIENSLPKLRDKTIDKFFNELVILLQNELGDSWTVKVDGDLSKPWKFPLKIYKKLWSKSNNGYLLIGFEFESHKYYNGFLGVVRSSEKVNIDEIKLTFKADMDSVSDDFKRDESYSSKWWIYGKKNSPIADDFVAQILYDNYTSVDFMQKVLKYIDELENKSNILSNINKYLKDGTK